MASVSIRPVRTRRELKRFVKVPFRLHRKHPQWVAPLIFERMEFLNRDRNPFFEHAEAEYFLAERDGEPVGRITAQVDRCWDERQGGSDAMFGFFETADDSEVAAALLGAASEWAGQKGRARILGPMDFTTNDEIGLLIEGYERRPMILENWHPPFYKELVEGEGFGKAIDLLAPLRPRPPEATLFLRNASWDRANALGRLGRHAEASRDWQRAIEFDPGPDRDHLRVFLTASQAGEKLAGQDKPSGNFLYEAAAAHARAAAAAEATDEADLRTWYTDRSLDLLKQAASAGWFRERQRVDKLKGDKRFDPLPRSRAMKYSPSDPGGMTSSNSQPKSPL